MEKEFYVHPFRQPIKWSINKKTNDFSITILSSPEKQDIPFRIDCLGIEDTGNDSENMIKDWPQAIDFALIRHKSNFDKPWLVIFMLHGWTSNKQTMIEQCEDMIKEMQKTLTPKQIQGTWFVPINAPFSMTCEERGTSLSDAIHSSNTLHSLVDEDTEQRFWWQIDGVKGLQDFLDNRLHRFFERREKGFDMSLAYLDSILSVVHNMTKGDASFCMMGFSQGGGMAFNTAINLFEKYPFCGVILCSSLLTNTDRCIMDAQRYTLKENMTFEKFKRVPLLLTHGYQDTTLFTEVGDRFYYFLSDKIGMKSVDYINFEGYHEITDQVRQRISVHIQRMYEYHKSQKTSLLPNYLMFT